MPSNLAASGMLPLVRFMAELEVPLVDGENMMAVDLFDLAHATKVLRLFGQAYEKLPEKTADMTREQKQFLEEAIAAIEHEGSVSPAKSTMTDMTINSSSSETPRRDGRVDFVLVRTCQFISHPPTQESRRNW